MLPQLRAGLFPSSPAPLRSVFHTATTVTKELRSSPCWLRPNEREICSPGPRGPVGSTASSCRSHLYHTGTSLAASLFREEDTLGPTVALPIPFARMFSPVGARCPSVPLVSSQCSETSSERPSLRCGRSSPRAPCPDSALCSRCCHQRSPCWFARLPQIRCKCSEGGSLTVSLLLGFRALTPGSSFPLMHWIHMR